MSQFGFSKWVCHSLVYTQEYNPNLTQKKKKKTNKQRDEEVACLIWLPLTNLG
jgi:hypothetical protein